MRVERIGLEHHRKPATRRRYRGGVGTIDQHLSRGDILKSGDQAKQRRLAAARRPDKNDELAILDLQIQRRDDLDVAKALRNLFQLYLFHLRLSISPRQRSGREQAVSG